MCVRERERDRDKECPLKGVLLLRSVTWTSRFVSCWRKFFFFLHFFAKNLKKKQKNLLSPTARALPSSALLHQEKKNSVHVCHRHVFVCQKMVDRTKTGPHFLVKVVQFSVT